ncbi:hypothetical protein [Desulfoscipio gibsoniae]|uniref:hypothetical protein n=1 Tax=Desulfoscipio gibsoniae TaxID=102134 RepID=UPI000317E88D|nr:hypothetical protein [Desulfoscipio gibsoniae]
MKSLVHYIMSRCLAAIDFAKAPAHSFTRSLRIEVAVTLLDLSSTKEEVFDERFLR